MLRRSRPLQISLDGQNTKQVWTTASTVDEALAQLAMTDTAPAAASRGSRVPLAGMALPVVSAKTVELDDGGAVHNVHLAAARVGELLAGLGVPLEQSDQVSPGAAAPVIDGMHIQVIRNRIEKITERVPLDPPRRRIEDPQLNMSKEIVEDKGAAGSQDMTYAVSKVNGIETGRLPVASHVIAPAREAIVRVGTKPGTRSRPSPTARSGTRSRAARPAATGRSTPETVTTAVCSSTRTPGNVTAACGLLRAPTWPAGKSRSPSPR